MDFCGFTDGPLLLPEPRSLDGEAANGDLDDVKAALVEDPGRDATDTARPAFVRSFRGVVGQLLVSWGVPERLSGRTEDRIDNWARISGATSKYQCRKS